MKTEDWISVKEQLPDKTNDVLALTKLMNGKPKQIIAKYTRGHEIEYYDDDYDGTYDQIEDKNGCLYLKPGWYECEEQVKSDYDEYWCLREVTHWMPLPEPPKP